MLWRFGFRRKYEKEISALSAAAALGIVPADVSGLLCRSRKKRKRNKQLVVRYRYGSQYYNKTAPYLCRKSFRSDLLAAHQFPARQEQAQEKHTISEPISVICKLVTK